MQTILVIDDDEKPSRHDRSHARKKEDFRPILGRRRQKTGLQEAITMKPSLILVDLRMPGISGVEVCKQLRGLRPCGTASHRPFSAIGATKWTRFLMLEIGCRRLRREALRKPGSCSPGFRAGCCGGEAAARKDNKVDRRSRTWEVDLDRRVVRRRRGMKLKIDSRRVQPADLLSLQKFPRRAHHPRH